MEKLPAIKAKFIISGDDFDIDNITGRLDISPTWTKARKDFENQEFAFTTWQYATSLDYCLSTDEKIDIIRAVFSDKIAVIRNICEELSLEVNIEVVIHMNTDDNPVVEISKQNISFINSLNADVGFDLYTYSEDE